MSDTPPTIVFGAGGTGGHIYPALAVAQSLRARSPHARLSFLCSDRAVDARIMDPSGERWTPTPARPFSLRPKGLIRFMWHWGASLRVCRAALAGADALVVTGGFVSAPAARAAVIERVPIVLLNLDAVPGKASRLIAGRARVCMTAQASGVTPATWERIPPVVRPNLLEDRDPSRCRSELGLDPDHPTLLITGGSQGARSLNEVVLATLDAQPDLFAGWQVLHQAGDGQEMLGRLTSAYERAGVPGVVLPFVDRMDLAWGASDAVVSRAGAGAVAEAWATRTPAVFLPYPFHADDHQRVNAQPLIEAGCALLVEDRVDASETLDTFVASLQRLLDHDTRCDMHAAYDSLGPADGAQCVAHRVLKLIFSSTS
ncbi:MAG: undecaprenyldiphospho-muramoylpentapeptide beta-N-acetylglucosaminyltransferase [Phycisphaerales bacterium]